MACVVVLATHKRLHPGTAWLDEQRLYAELAKPMADRLGGELGPKTIAFSSLYTFQPLFPSPSPSLLHLTLPPPFIRPDVLRRPVRDEQVGQALQYIV